MEGEIAPELWGARLSRVDLPHDHLLALTLRAPDLRGVLIFALDGVAPCVGLVDERPRGRAANALVQRIRKLFGGARLERMHLRGPAVRLVFRRGPHQGGLAVELGGGGNLVLLDSEGLVVGASGRRVADRDLSVGATWAPPPRPGPVVATSLEGLRADGPEVLNRLTSGELSRAQRALDRALQKAERRVARRAKNVAADAARAEQAPALRHQADLILAHLHAWERGSHELHVTDWGEDPPADRRLPIDPKLGPRAQAEALYHRAKRLLRGREMACQRAETTAAEATTLRALRERCGLADSAEKLASLAEEARGLGVRGAVEAIGAVAAHPTRSRAQPGERQPFRRFEGAEGRTILVGRGARDNDALTLRRARPQDMWLHARGRTGAHVIVPLDRGETCPEQLLVDAATLAAHFSDAAGEDRVEVQYTPRRFVRKPRGLPPGAVMVDREKVMTLRLEPARLERLKATERR